MTALEAMRAGCVFVRDDRASLVTVRGHKDLVAQVSAEVARRADAMGKPPQLAVRHGACDACGDPMAPYRAGWCELCHLARRVALKKAGVIR